MFELIGVDVTERDVTLSFVASRMRVIDEQKERARILLTHLAFEDMLEALCRLACRKAFPTPEEIKELGDEEVTNAGQYLLKIRDDAPEVYDTMMLKRSQPYGSKPLQPFHVCLEHLCTLLIVTCQAGTGNPAPDGKHLTEKEVNAFMKVSHAG